MIREAHQKDIEEIYKMQKGNFVTLEMDNVNDIYSSAKKFIVWDESGIKGYAYLFEYSKEKKEWDMQIYVEDKERRRGIGTALYKELQHILEAENPSVVITEFRKEIDKVKLINSISEQYNVSTSIK